MKANTKVNINYVSTRVRDILLAQQQVWGKKVHADIEALKKQIDEEKKQHARQLPTQVLVAVGIETLVGDYPHPVAKRAHKKLHAAIAPLHKQQEALETSLKTEYNHRAHRDELLCVLFKQKHNEVMDSLVLGGTPVEKLLSDLQKWIPGK